MKNLKTMLSSEDMTWETPQDFFDELNKEFNFTLDPCATIETAKCKKFYMKEDDGLKQDWTDEIVFCNPPYGSEIKNWVEKCSKEKAKIVMLIPARTDTRYFHEYIYQKPNVQIRFIKGRLKFGGKQKGSGSAPFPSMIVIFNNPPTNRE
ncbi:MAG: DNA N-6-adenine-methyltransferase [Patescibacteria group bacterium]